MECKKSFGIRMHGCALFSLCNTEKAHAQYIVCLFFNVLLKNREKRYQGMQTAGRKAAGYDG